MNMQLHAPLKTARVTSARPTPTGILQRKCDKFQKKKRALQRLAVSSTPEAVPPIVHGVLHSSEAPLDPATRAFKEPRFAHDFSQVPAQSRSLARVQAKLTVGSAGDVFEQEADRIADQVLAAPEHPAVSSTAPCIQRFSGQSQSQTDVVPTSVDQALASPGRPLEPALQQDMGRSFGHDFSRVRVHSGGAAEQSARDVNAHAYTVGHDIVFGAGRFAPETHEGRRLLAHELTHVVQQSGTDGIRVEPHPVIRRQQASESPAPTAEQVRETELRQLAMLPHLALKQWKTLKQSERDQVLRNMILRYGAPFTSEFLNYAKGVKKPKPGLAGALKGPEYTTKWLFDQGYRHAYGEIWVRPSGEYLMVLPPDQAGTEQPDPEPDPAKCVEPCLNQTQNEDDCKQCCQDTIPAEDERCRRACDLHCSEDKL